MCPCFEEDVRCSGRVVACGVVSMCHEHVLCRSYACVGAPTVFCGHGRVVSKAQSPWSGRPAKATRLDRAAASALEESQKSRAARTKSRATRRGSKGTTQKSGMHARFAASKAGVRSGCSCTWRASSIPWHGSGLIVSLLRGAMTPSVI